MRTRLITACALLGLLGLLLQHPSWAWYVLWPLGWGLAYEWAGLSNVRTVWGRMLYATTLAGASLGFSRDLHLGHVYFLINLSATLWGLQVAYVLMNRKEMIPVAARARWILGFFLMPISLLLASYLLEHKPALLLAMVLMVALSDSAAYGVGRLMGKHTLAPALSPKKTWEGFFGALAVAIPVGALWLAPAFHVPLHGHALWIWCGVVVVMGVFGDLMESAYKRMQGVKDSGRCLPGHGGLLDRCDAHLATLPVAAYLILL